MLKDKKQCLFSMMIVIIIITLIIFSIFEIKKNKDIERYIYGEYSESNYKNNFKEIKWNKLNVKNIKNINELIKEEKCFYSFDLNKYYNENKYKASFVLECKKDIMSFSKESNIKTKEKDNKSIHYNSLHYSSKYKVFLIKKELMKKKSPSELISILKLPELDYFFKEVLEEIKNRKKEKEVMEEKISDWYKL